MEFFTAILYRYPFTMSLACSAAILPPSPFIGDQTEKDLSQRGDASASPSHPAACESQTLVADLRVKSSGSLQRRTRYPARTTGESYLDGLQRRDKGSLCSDAGGKASPDLQHAPRPTDDRKVVSRAIEASLATKCQPKDPAVVEPRAPHLTSANPTNAQPRINLRVWNEANSILARCKHDESTESQTGAGSTFTFDSFLAGCRRASDVNANGDDAPSLKLTSTRGTTTPHQPFQPTSNINPTTEGGSVPERPTGSASMRKLAPILPSNDHCETENARTEIDHHAGIDALDKKGLVTGTRAVALLSIFRRIDGRHPTLRDAAALALQAAARGYIARMHAAEAISAARSRLAGIKE